VRFVRRRWFTRAGAQDMTSKNDMFRANSIRALAKIVDVRALHPSLRPASICVVST
jgi:hypothetical protein